MLRKLALTIALITSINFLPSQTTTSDKDWAFREVTLKGSMEADFIIRIGDVDNLGFGWPEGFDPFCGRMTEAHAWPWDHDPAETPGFDRILVGTNFKGGEGSCGSDGYSGTCEPGNCSPVAWKVPLDALKGEEIRDAFLQLFIDDFQAPSLCSEFQLTVNGIRFVEGERILNAIDQSGPVGKLISLPLPQEFFPALKAGGVLNVKIDETKGAADGWAVDFMRLMVNRKREKTCRANKWVHVLDIHTEQSIPGARVYSSDRTEGLTDENGTVLFEGIPTGFEIFSASARGYSDGSASGDVSEDDNNEIWIGLDKSKTSVTFDGKSIGAGESINLNKILFDQGKTELGEESKAELEKVIEFLVANQSAEIELSGHTSSEGEEDFNRSLSYQRVKSCKDYIVARGIDTGRVIVIGCGPDRPTVPNDSDENRALNRRVEMRVLKL